MADGVQGSVTEREGKNNLFFKKKQNHKKIYYFFKIAIDKNQFLWFNII